MFDLGAWHTNIVYLCVTNLKSRLRCATSKCNMSNNFILWSFLTRCILTLQIGVAKGRNISHDLALRCLIRPFISKSTISCFLLKRWKFWRWRFWHIFNCHYTLAPRVSKHCLSQCVTVLNGTVSLLNELKFYVRRCQTVMSNFVTRLK